MMGKAIEEGPQRASAGRPVAGCPVFIMETADGRRRVLVTESAIDALSLAAIEDWRASTLYVSTGGGWGPETDRALRKLLLPGMTLGAATDKGAGGEMMAARLAQLAAGSEAGFVRLEPMAKDWNDQIRGVQA